ncbi:MAG: hypothetical protein R3F11_26930 [Verrucomicrobiales bacterium]
MESEILEALKDTNQKLDRLTVLVVIGVVVWLLKSTVVIFSHGTSILKRRWREKAQNLYEDGKLEKLLAKANQMISALPNHPEGYFWRALAERDLGRDEAVRKSVARLIELAPDWKETWMDKFVETPPNRADGGGQKPVT